MKVILSCQYLGDFKLRTAKSEQRGLEQCYGTARVNERLGYMSSRSFTVAVLIQVNLQKPCRIIPDGSAKLDKLLNGW